MAKTPQLLLAAVLGGLICTVSVAVSGAATSLAAAAAGRTLYNTNCAICHLATGAGGIKFGDAVSANLQAPALEAAYYGKDALILRAILYARDQDGAPLDLPMPAWTGRLTTQQAKDIIAYLHTLKSP